MVNQLENGTETLSITDANAAPRQVRYITDNQMMTKSAKELYYCWLSRLVMLFAVLSLGFFTSASLVLFKLAPEVMVEPFLIIKQDSSDSMVRYETIAPDMPSSNQIMDTFIRQYVILRNTVLNDEREMQSRWYAGGMCHIYLHRRSMTNLEKSNLKALMICLRPKWSAMPKLFPSAK